MSSPGCDVRNAKHSRRRASCLVVPGPAVRVRAEHDGTGALIVAGHNRTAGSELYATNGMVRGLTWEVATRGHGAIETTAMYALCELPLIWWRMVRRIAQEPVDPAVCAGAIPL